MIAVNVANAAKKRGPEGSGPSVRPASERRPSGGATQRARESEPQAKPQRASAQRQPQQQSRERRRPQKVPGGNGARIFAPIAIAVVAIACFTVLTSQDSTGGSADRGDQTTKTTGSEKSSETSGGNSAAGGSATAEADIPATYRVKAGDSFAAIAEKFGLDANALAELNPDTDPRALQPGQKLKLKE